MLCTIRQEAARVVLDTLNPNDYVNVVDFDSRSRTNYVPPCFSSTMAKATPRNRRILIDFIANNVREEGGTYYGDALSRAYGLLKQGQSAGQTAGAQTCRCSG